MIRHVYSDGSEGYEYEVGDRVRLNENYPYQRTPLNQLWAEVTRVARGGPRHLRKCDLKMLPSEWPCPVDVWPWMMEPSAATIFSAKVVVGKS